jgi:hypothetical protein
MGHKYVGLDVHQSSTVAAGHDAGAGRCRVSDHAVAHGRRGQGELESAMRCGEPSQRALVAIHASHGPGR